MHKIRTILFREGDWWVGQCLDIDIAAQARTQEGLRQELMRLLAGRALATEKLGVEPFQGLPPAPRRFWDLFFGARSESQTVESFAAYDLPANPLPEVEMRVSQERLGNLAAEHPEPPVRLDPDEEAG